MFSDPLPASHGQESFPAFDLPTLLSPELTQVNRLPARATFTAYPDVESARTLAREDSPWFLSLDGEWQAHLAHTPAEAFQFVRRPAGAQRWQPIRVPGHWQLQGFWDRPHYTNIEMPFDLEPPHVPEENPTCVYRRVLRVPAAWEGQRVVLHFGGADNTLLVYLDGRFVGLSKDSRCPAEYDLTALVRPGTEHELTAVVIKWSGTSWIEDQDHWWLSGLHREVFLYATRPVHLADIQARAGLADDLATGTLDVRVALGFPRLAVPGCRVEAQLFDPAGQPVLGQPLTADIDASRASYQRWPGPAAWLTATLPAVQAWNAETPHLYTLVVTLTSSHGTESTRVRVGFRRVEVRDRNLLINGRRVLIKGVNRHDHDDEGGKAVPREHMLQDVLTMKRFNVNAVRTSHYPNDPHFLDLCDEHGLYVIDEANIEAHATHNLTCRDPRYAPAFLDHMMNMVQRDKNHPSIFAWSLGNESGHGPNHDAIAGWTRATDPTRLLHYEGGISTIQGKFHWDTDPTRPLSWDDGHAVTDIVGPMYPEVDKMVAWCRETKDRRPMILCEFNHAMGNGNGCLGEYFDAFENTPGLQGGFIWQWIDHGLKQHDAEGRAYWAYGGDFGDAPNDANFLCGGLVWPDRTPHTGLYEFKHLAQPVAVEAIDADAGRLRIRNKQNFTTLAWLRGTWRLTVNGVVVQTGELPLLHTAPQTSEEVTLPLQFPVAQADSECFVLVRFKPRERTPWGDLGHIVAQAQVAVLLPPDRVAPTAAKEVLHTGPLEVSDDGGAITVRGTCLEAIVSKETGALVSFRWHGRDFLLAGPTLNVWRAPTDNDGIKAWTGQNNKPLGRWLDAGLHHLTRQVESIHVRQDEHGHPTVETVHRVTAKGGGFEHRETLTFLPTGEVRFDNVVMADPSLPDLPRVGVAFALPPGLEVLHWFGRGPHECYPDRQRSGVVGLYWSGVDAQYVPYIVPQSHGNHTDVRWFMLLDTAGNGLRFSGGEHFQFSASHFSADDLYRAPHTVDLKPRPEIFVTLDHVQRGLGTSSCGPDTLPKYRIPPGTFRFSYHMQPFTGYPVRPDPVLPPS